MSEAGEREIRDEPPPLFSGWSGWYALVLGVLVVMILLFTWFSVAFS